MNVNVNTSSSSPRSKVTVSNVPQVITVTKGSTSGGSGGALSDLSDVNTSTATDGAVLQYDAATGIWIAENILEKSGLQINCGNF